MSDHDHDEEPAGADDEASGAGRQGDGSGMRPHEDVRRSEAHANARPGTHDSELHPDTAETMQDDRGSEPGRQRYADARPGDYGRDFQVDGSGSHPVKPASEDAVDENGIPHIAETEPPERRSGD